MGAKLAIANPRPNSLNAHWDYRSSSGIWFYSLKEQFPAQQARSPTVSTLRQAFPMSCLPPDSRRRRQCQKSCASPTGVAVLPDWSGPPKRTLAPVWGLDLF